MGLSDVQVRLWKVERSAGDIVKFMRRTGGSLDNHRDLIAYWKFNEPDECATFSTCAYITYSCMLIASFALPISTAFLCR